MTPITRYVPRPILISLFSGFRVPKRPFFTSEPITQTSFLKLTSKERRNRPVSGKALPRRTPFSVVPMTVTPSIVSTRYFTSWSPAMDGLTIALPRSFSSSIRASRRSRFGRLRKEKKSFITTQGIRETYITSVPTAEKLSRNLFRSPLAAVMVTTTATIPMMMPRVVKAPRPLLARMARRAILSDSRKSSACFMTSALGGSALLLRGLLRIVDRDDRPVLQILRERAVAAGDDLVPFLEALQHLDQIIALDSGLDLLGDRLAVLDAEHDLDEAVLVGLVGGLGRLRDLAPLLPLDAELIQRPHGDALERHAEGVIVGAGDDVGARGHARTKRLGRIRDGDLDLEFGLLVRRARARGPGAARDLGHDPLQGLAGERVHLDLGGLPDGHGHDVVLVHVDLGFHHRQVGDDEDDVLLELRPQRDLPLLLVQGADRAGHGRVDGGLGEIVARLLQGRLGLLHLVVGGLVTRHFHLVLGLLGLEGSLRLQSAGEELLGPLEFVLRARHVLAYQRRVRLGRAHAGLRALHRGEIALAVQPGEKLSLLDRLPLDDRQLDDLGAHVRADLDLGLGLDLPRGADFLNDLLPLDLGGLDFRRLAAMTAQRRAAHRGDDDETGEGDPTVLLLEFHDRTASADFRSRVSGFRGITERIRPDGPISYHAVGRDDQAPVNAGLARRKPLPDSDHHGIGTQQVLNVAI